MQSLLEVVIGDDRVRVTEEHPFWVTGEGWVSAEALEPGDCVRTLAGTCQAVVSVQLASADTWVYNLTIGDMSIQYNLEYASFQVLDRDAGLLPRKRGFLSRFLGGTR